MIHTSVVILLACFVAWARMRKKKVVCNEVIFPVEHKPVSTRPPASEIILQFANSDPVLMSMCYFDQELMEILCDYVQEKNSGRITFNANEVIAKAVLGSDNVPATFKQRLREYLTELTAAKNSEEEAA